MDDEDLRDAEDAKKVHTADGFAGLGSTEADRQRTTGLLDFFRIEGETMGVKLLKRMGWKEGQGIGPKVRRLPREGGTGKQHLFAPENTSMITLTRKTDHRGLGCHREARLDVDVAAEGASDDDVGTIPTQRSTTRKSVPTRGGMGIGVLNDTGSDDEDPYTMGPSISYNRVMGGDKRKKKKPAATTTANPILHTKPVFISKKAALVKSAMHLRKCHDGRLPLDGFVLATGHPSSPSLVDYPAPEIPAGWKSAKSVTPASTTQTYISPADAAKSSTLKPNARASLLGEAVLPGKSVFDYLPAAARDRIMASTGRTDLPPALGEIPAEYQPMSSDEHRQKLLAQIPHLDKATALAALTRAATGSGGFIPYADDTLKRGRYLAYLSHAAGLSTTPLALPDEASISTPKIRDDWLKELHEFRNCAAIFKPMSGLMATRFTSSSTTVSSTPSLSTPLSEDPSTQAARLGMYGALTRTVHDFHPTRLLCKRFNVKPPAHVVNAGSGTGEEQSSTTGSRPDDLLGKEAIDVMMGAYNDAQRVAGGRASGDAATASATATTTAPPIVVDVEKNEALEGKRAGEAVFRAIFGDDSESESDDGGQA